MLMLFGGPSACSPRNSCPDLWAAANNKSASTVTNGAQRNCLHFDFDLALALRIWIRIQGR